MKILFLFLTIFLLNCGKRSDTEEKSGINNSFENNLNIHNDISKSKTNISISEDFNEKKIGSSNKKSQKDSSNILKYLPVNYSLEGNVDYTNYVQKAFNEVEKITMPNFPIAINYKGINIPSNRTITFQQKSSLSILPNSQPSYQALLISNSSNVKIINANLIGDRNQHTGTKGEWGMGIKIMSSKNIDIINSNIKNFWGDGIYIGRNANNVSYCSGINVFRGILDNNRRNGISIVSGKDIIIENITIKNTNGTNPMAGIDLEPNSPDEFLYNINLNNISTINNKIDGIKVVLQKLVNSNNILVNINNHDDIGSPNPLTVVGYDVATKAKGILNYSNAKWNNDKNIRIQRELNSSINLNIQKININGKLYNKTINTSNIQR